MKKHKVFQFNINLNKVTGIQRVMLDIHEALKDDFNAIIVGNIPYDKVDVNLGISQADYIKFKNPLLFRDSVVIIHERRLLPLMWVMTHIPGLKVRCIYVHHSELNGNKLFSFFPKNIIAISDRGIDNLTKYFKVPIFNITKIHNCVRESNNFCDSVRKAFDPQNIVILYPGRINRGKQQIEMVRRLSGKLDSRIKIQFAGIGPLYDELKEICKNNNQFEVLGFQKDIPGLLRNVDFMMLFSTHEGLPISLLEASQNGTPIICNDVGGNCEIVQNGKNGIIVNDWDSLINLLNSLPAMNGEYYGQLSLGGPAVIMEKFSFSKFKTRYLEVIYSLFR